ncbi:MAG: HD-GYP domain-containing protein (c-di-GMP phosphodiesterase class II) [Bermanella sp.]|jgi:HD-GYP domain-containing protein (c-di-GMP phosphodiesterase class II)
MSNPQASDFDPEIISDLKDELNEKRQNCNDHLLRLEEEPEHKDTVAKLFRDVHTVKGDLGIMGIYQYLPLLQSVEDLMDNLRKGQKSLTPALGDVLLLSLDLAFTQLELFLNNKDGDFDSISYNKLAKMITKLARLEGNEAEQQTLAIVQTLAPETAPSKEEDARQTEAYFTEEEINEEVAFFLQLSLLIDQRSPYGSGRTQRLFELAMTMNQLAGNPIKTSQLQAAIYLHDLGMAFMPKAMMNKVSELTQHDWKWVETHVSIIHQLISPFEIWNDASEIILQHHERINGSGYPSNLTEKDICEGAKLLAIVDSFEAITQTRAYQDVQQRPMMRAIMEINQHSGTIYCPKWVEHFNQAVKRLHVKKAKK